MEVLGVRRMEVEIGVIAYLQVRPHPPGLTSGPVSDAIFPTVEMFLALRNCRRPCVLQSGHWGMRNRDSYKGKLHVYVNTLVFWFGLNKYQTV